MRLFISYSHDSVQHCAWVAELAKRLKSSKIDVRLDQTHLSYGEDINRFMESEIARADVVIVVCTPNYVTRSNQRTGGVGYESVILSSELLRDQDSRKFLPVVRSICADTRALPAFLGNRLYADLTERDGFGDNFFRIQAQLEQQSNISTSKNSIVIQSDKKIVEVEGPVDVVELSQESERVLQLFGANNLAFINFEIEDLEMLFKHAPFRYVVATTTEKRPNYGSLAQHAAIQANLSDQTNQSPFRSIAISISGPRAFLKLSDARVAMNVFRRIASDDANILYSTAYRDEGARIVLAFS